jgi:membrane protein DedA with SNARE-associated domain
MKSSTFRQSNTFARTERVSRRLALVGVVLAAILVPFFAFGDAMEAWAEGFAYTQVDQATVPGLILGALLAADIVLPVPSSLVSTALGALLGWAGGFVVSTLGMTAACWTGYRLGQSAGRGAARRLVSERDLAWLESASERWGSGVIVLFRAVPALAETSAIFAGMSRMPVGKFMLISTLSNAGISAVYAAVGAYSANVNSFLLAFTGALLLPGLAMLAVSRVRRNGRAPVPHGQHGGEESL